MTYHEIAEQATRLPVRERLVLPEILSRSLREDLAAPQTAPAADAVAIVNRLFGILRTDGPAPTDAEIKEEYTDFLIHKYS
jgi:hypothetical protein